MQVEENVDTIPNLWIQFYAPLKFALKYHLVLLDYPTWRNLHNYYRYIERIT
jgi:hypothetical protein